MGLRARIPSFTLTPKIPSLPPLLDSLSLLHSRAVVQGENWLPIVRICHHQVHLYTFSGMPGKRIQSKEEGSGF